MINFVYGGPLILLLSNIILDKLKSQDFPNKYFKIQSRTREMMLRK